MNHNRQNPGSVNMWCRGMLVLVLILFGMTGCSLLPQKETEEDSRNLYRVYYTDAAQSRLLETSYEPQEQTFEGLLTEMLDKFEHPEEIEAEAVSVIPKGIKINGYTIGVDSLLVDFSGSYISLGNVEEILLRAGIVKTLVQLPGIYSVSLTVDGQPLQESSSGQTVGPMRDETFVDSQGDSINSYQFVKLQLYFPTRNGEQIMAEEREAFYSSNLILERVIVDQLIKGPQNPGLQKIVNSSVQVNSVRVTDDICVIDLDDDFVQNWNNEISAQIGLYAFVDSVCLACDVKGVAFRINGSADVRFQDEISLDQIFEPDESLIRQPETAAASDGENAEAEEKKDTAQQDQEKTGAADPDGTKDNNKDNNKENAADSADGNAEGGQEADADIAEEANVQADVQADDGENASGNVQAGSAVDQSSAENTGVEDENAQADIAEQVGIVPEIGVPEANITAPEAGQ